MSAWDANSVANSGLTREQAIEKIKLIAKEHGYTGGFKVTYNGSEVETPNDLPATGVDMTKVVVASKLNNA